MSAIDKLIAQKNLSVSEAKIATLEMQLLNTNKPKSRQSYE